MDEDRRVERRTVRRSGPCLTGGGCDHRLAAEQPHADGRPVQEPPARIAVRAVQQEPRTQLCLGIGLVLGQNARHLDDPPRQDRPALDQDQLAGDRHERADVAEAVGLERRQGVEIRIGEGAERDRDHVQLARLDQGQEQGQGSVERLHPDLGRGIGPSTGTEHDRGRCRPEIGELGGHHEASSAMRSCSPAIGSSGASW